MWPQENADNGPRNRKVTANKARDCPLLPKKRWQAPAAPCRPSQGRVWSCEGSHCVSHPPNTRPISESPARAQWVDKFRGENPWLQPHIDLNVTSGQLLTLGLLIPSAGRPLTDREHSANCAERNNTEGLNRDPCLGQPAATLARPSSHSILRGIDRPGDTAHSTPRHPTTGIPVRGYLPLVCHCLQRCAAS